MAITKRVQTELSNVLPSEPRSTRQSRSNKNHQQHAELVPAALAPLPRDSVASATSNNSTTAPQTHNSAHQNCNANCSNKGKTWTPAEHERFVQALQLFPAGPWKAIAAVVGTKTPRQTMTHAQKCRQKLERRQRGLKIQTRRLVESCQQQQQRLFPSQDEEERSTNRLQSLLTVHGQEPPSPTASQDRIVPVVVAHPAINGALRDDAALIHARSHVTSMTSSGAGDARSLTLSWSDAHNRAQEQEHRQQRQQQQQQQQLLHSHNGSMEMVSDFAVLGAFENTYSSSSMMWGDGSHVSSMGLRLPVMVAAEEFCVSSNEVADTLTSGFLGHQLWPAN